MSMIYLPHRRKAWRTSGAFTPSSIATLKMWYDCQQESWANNADVNAITDRSGSGYNLSSTIPPYTPTFKTGLTNGSATFSGLLCSASNDLYTGTINALGLTTSGTDVTTFLVLKQDGANANNGPFGITTTSSRLGSYATFGNTIYWDVANDTGGRTSVAQPSGWDDNWHVLEMFRSGSISGIIVDGTSLVSGTGKTGTVANETGVFHLVKFVVGFIGYISEFLLYSSAISSEDRTAVRNYLKTRYGIT